MNEQPQKFYLAFGAVGLGLMIIIGSIFVDPKPKTDDTVSVDSGDGAATRRATQGNIESDARVDETSIQDPIEDDSGSEKGSKSTVELQRIKPESPRKNPDKMPKGDPNPLFKSGELGRGQTVGGALKNFGIGHKTITDIIKALDGLYDFRYAQPGARFEAQLSRSGRLKRFQFEHDQMEVYIVERNTEGRLVGRQALIPVRTEVGEISGRIKGSLYATIKRMSEDPRLASKLVSVFAWDLDFFKDSRPNDQFKMVVEKFFKDDDFVQYGKVLAAEYSGKRGTFQSFWFKPSGDSQGGYYLKNGESAEKIFLATPLKFARISSGFNRKRKHPILGYEKAHLGVDYAAPKGTPVWAMAGGKVIYSGRKGPNGNLVRIEHSNGLVSGYAHLHKIRSEIKKGKRVKQKQVIGYVGSTGRSTGPHLHFSIRKNGNYVNPKELKVTRLKSVPKKDRRRFKKSVKQMTKKLSRMTVAE